MPLPPPRDAFAGPDAKRAYVRRLFATIADRYDDITRVLSFGQDARWKARLVAMAAPARGQHVLDLACGTGDLALAARARGGTVTGLDLVARMLELARAKPGGTDVRWLVGDMTRLPIADASMDVVTTGYGLRNVPDLRAAIAEIHRVLRPGGTAWSLDFNRPDNAAVRAIYLAWLWSVGGLLGWILHRDTSTYQYIPASIRRYPGARRVAGMMREAGFREADVVPVLGGLMAIHRVRK